MIRKFKAAVIEILQAFNPTRSQLEAMMKLDFKMGDEQAQQIQLCFSNLAAWPLLLIAVGLYFDPSRYSWTLQKSLLNFPDQAYFLLDGRLANMILFFAIFYFIQWIIRSEFFLLSLLFYFLLKSDIHLHLALSAVLGIFLSKACYLWWMHKDIQSKARQIWKSFSVVQIIGCVISCMISLFLLQIFSSLGYFSNSYSINRFEFLVEIVTLNYFLPLMFSALWGHFYFQPKLIEPTEFPTNYSTANWMLRFRIRSHFKKQLSQQIEKYLVLHKNNLADLESIKDLGPASIPHKISQIIKAELSYLELASSRLTIE